MKERPLVLGARERRESSGRGNKREDREGRQRKREESVGGQRAEGFGGSECLHGG